MIALDPCNGPSRNPKDLSRETYKAMEPYTRECSVNNTLIILFSVKDNTIMVLFTQFSLRTAKTSLGGMIAVDGYLLTMDAGAPKEHSGLILLVVFLKLGFVTDVGVQR